MPIFNNKLGNYMISKHKIAFWAKAFILLTYQPYSYSGWKHLYYTRIYN